MTSGERREMVRELDRARAGTRGQWLTRLSPVVEFEAGAALTGRAGRTARTAAGLLERHGTLCGDPPGGAIQGVVADEPAGMAPTLLRVAITPGDGIACRVHVAAVARDNRPNGPSARLAAEWLVRRIADTVTDPARDPTVYEGSGGDTIVNPTPDAVLPYLNEGEEYWEGQAGSAWIGRRRIEADGGVTVLPSQYDYPNLHIFRHALYGVRLEYSRGEPLPGLVAFDPSLPEGDIEYFVGGEPQRFPRLEFIGRTEAAAAITHFLMARAPDPAVPWRSVRSGDQ